MDFTYLSDILHAVSQALLAPDIILLLLFILYALFCIGSVIAEYFTERQHFKVVMPKFLAALMAANEEDIPQVIADSGLLKRQKIALYTVYEYRALPGEALVALVRRLVNEEETHYDRITGRNNMAAKVSPMLGLMGTLIPLGPGIQALGKADTAVLSNSLLVAFDTTVAGLVTAAVCLVVGKIRSNWYDNYLSALDASMATMMEKIEAGRDTSTASLPDGTKEPTDYSFLFAGNVTSSAQQAVAASAAAGAEVAGSLNADQVDGPAQNGTFEPAAISGRPRAFASGSEFKPEGAPDAAGSAGAPGASDAAKPTE